jgi:ABC-type uncharacterized transport system ATPase subunit
VGGFTLALCDLYVASERGGWGVQGLNLTVQAGEIVGIAGVDGSGQAELMDALAGLRPIARGEILLAGQPMHCWSTARRIQAGVRFLFDDRFRRMMAPQWSVRENAILGAQRDPELQTLGWLKPRAPSASAPSNSSSGFRSKCPRCARRFCNCRAATSSDW